MKIHTITLPEWLVLGTCIIGAEDPPNGDSGTPGEPAGDSGEPAGGNAADDEEGDDGDDPKDTDGLKSALVKERKAAKAAAREAKAKERELAALRKEKEERELAEKGETEQERIKREKAEAKLERLSVGYRNRAVEEAIRAAATKLKFIDNDDAVSGVDRSDITVEQDEDDPSVVTIDPKTVEKAVKDLAARKRHLISTGTSDGDRTGSRFGGAGGGDKKKTSEETLREQYPALR